MLGPSANWSMLAYQLAGAAPRVRMMPSVSSVRRTIQYWPGSRVVAGAVKVTHLPALMVTTLSPCAQRPAGTPLLSR